ncbi:MAG: TrmH family RNA methyltransferase [bacterium]|nr:TrmH family RNA methyltransferase [bacterium]
MEIVVALHNIRSLHNVGSIFRTADAAGVLKIYLSGITPSPLDRFGKVRQQIAKVSLSAEEYVPWEKSATTGNLIYRLKDKGYKIFAIEQSKKSVPYYSINSKSRALKKVVLVLGSEIEGLPKTILQKCDKILEIPMYGHKESLNVAVAFGIVAFSLAHD